MRFSPRLPLALTAMMLMLLAACGNDDGMGPRLENGIAGTVLFEPQSIDLTNARVAVYTSVENVHQDLVFVATPLVRTGSDWSFKIQLEPGTYYLDLWRDDNRNGMKECKEPGDLWCPYESGMRHEPAPIQVRRHEMCSIRVMVHMEERIGIGNARMRRRQCNSDSLLGW